MKIHELCFITNVLIALKSLVSYLNDGINWYEITINVAFYFQGCYGQIVCVN